MLVLASVAMAYAVWQTFRLGLRWILVTGPTTICVWYLAFELELPFAATGLCLVILYPLSRRVKRQPEPHPELEPNPEPYPRCAYCGSLSDYGDSCQNCGAAV